MTESLTTSAEEGINIIMDYTVLSCWRRQISEPHHQSCPTESFISSIYPERCRGYVRSAWNRPVHCHAVFSSSDAFFAGFSQLNEPAANLFNCQTSSPISLKADALFIICLLLLLLGWRAAFALLLFFRAPDNAVVFCLTIGGRPYLWNTYTTTKCFSSCKQMWAVLREKWKRKPVKPVPRDSHEEESFPSFPGTSFLVLCTSL